MKHEFEHQIQCERVPIETRDILGLVRSLYGRLARRIARGEELATLIRLDEDAVVWAAENLVTADNSRSEFYEKGFQVGVLHIAAVREEVSPIHDSTLWSAFLWISLNLDPAMWLGYGFSQGTEAYPLPHAWIECKTSEIGVMRRFKDIFGKYGEPWPGMKARPTWEIMR